MDSYQFTVRRTLLIRSLRNAFRRIDDLRDELALAEQQVNELLVELDARIEQEK